MDEEKFDAIVVGGGLAGLTAAYVMAQAGLAVVLVERGTSCGSKNVTGGKLCSHSIEKVFPNFAEIAPIERRITTETVMTWSPGECSPSGINAASFGLTESQSYSVIRAKLDKWLSEQAEEAGVMLITGINVSDLIIRDGKVCGIIADGDELEANAVILAEGVNGLLAQKLGMSSELRADETCVGTKEVIELSRELINERFGLSGSEGVERMYLGDRSRGEYADGFLYTNKDSVSVGIEFLIGDIDSTAQSIPDMLEDFKSLPEIAPLLEGGQLVEYSAHLVKKGGSVGKLSGNGILLAGDTAGLVANFGWVIRGMDMAVESGRLAAEAVIKASETGDFSEAALSAYETAIENSFISNDMKLCNAFLKA